ncbi:hypothetical protein [Leptolyngbya sp. Cla-17]|uniref:hypothetical protein n=1 Tax=Leptolyngbya sp. Cla-17 TaxID=2803751 RepID=UPI00149161BB|nr:hypothetical protein [Leptolyngbya sp. Cla-17]
MRLINSDVKPIDSRDRVQEQENSRMPAKYPPFASKYSRVKLYILIYLVRQD